MAAIWKSDICANNERVTIAKITLKKTCCQWNFYRMWWTRICSFQWYKAMVNLLRILSIKHEKFVSFLWNPVSNLRIFDPHNPKCWFYSVPYFYPKLTIITQANFFIIFAENLKSVFWENRVFQSQKLHRCLPPCNLRRTQYNAVHGKYTGVISAIEKRDFLKRRFSNFRQIW